MKKTYLLLMLGFCSLLVQAQTSDFELCGEKRKNPYYFEVPYKISFYEVKNHFYTNYDSSKYKDIKDNTGMIHIVFHVNCKGKTGNYFLETFDYDYKYCVMSEELKNEFLRLTKELKVFQPFTPNEKIQNFHKFYIFKLKNGELIDILPK